MRLDKRKAQRIRETLEECRRMREEQQRRIVSLEFQVELFERGINYEDVAGILQLRKYDGKGGWIYYLAASDVQLKDGTVVPLDPPIPYPFQEGLSLSRR